MMSRASLVADWVFFNPSFPRQQFLFLTHHPRSVFYPWIFFMRSNFSVDTDIQFKIIFYTAEVKQAFFFIKKKKNTVSHWSNTALCAFLHVIMATTNKIDSGFYKTVSWVAMLNVRSGSITVRLIDCKLVTGSVYRSLRNFLSRTPWILPFSSFESPISSSCIQHYLSASLRSSLTNTCLA